MTYSPASGHSSRMTSSAGYLIDVRVEGALPWHSTLHSSVCTYIATFTCFSVCLPTWGCGVLRRMSSVILLDFYALGGSSYLLVICLSFSWNGWMDIQADEQTDDWVKLNHSLLRYCTLSSVVPKLTILSISKPSNFPEELEKGTIREFIEVHC